MDWKKNQVIFKYVKDYKELKYSWEQITKLLSKQHNIITNAECVRKAYASWMNSDKEIVVENVKNKKQTQRYADTNRIERKSFREYARIENAFKEFNGELVKTLNQYNLAKYTKQHLNNSSKAAGIVQINDLHFNELVDLPFNKFDFTVSSQRLKKLADKTIQYFKAFGVKNILVAMLGDLLNSDRRLDELLSMATNRSRATVLAVDMLNQFLLHLNQYFNIKVACVSGNEGRVKDEPGFSEMLATDNYDFTIFEFLKREFRGSKGIVFERGDDPKEQVVNVGGQLILLNHGESFKKDTEKSVERTIGRWASKGKKISFVIFGHFHSCRIGDTYSRGGSLPGANAYSEHGLNLISRASQNIHMIYDEYNRDSIKIDLQDVGGVKGYEIDKDFEAYNIKSVKKLHKEITIFKVTV